METRLPAHGQQRRHRHICLNDNLHVSGGLWWLLGLTCVCKARRARHAPREAHCARLLHEVFIEPGGVVGFCFQRPSLSLLPLPSSFELASKPLRSSTLVVYTAVGLSTLTLCFVAAFVARSRKRKAS